MYPVLYPANSLDFSTNGLGALSDAIECVVTEERNGAFEARLVYPANGLHFDEIREGMFLKVKPNDTSDWQLFRIYSMSERFDGNIEIDSEHLSYELNNYPVTQLWDEMYEDEVSKITSNNGPATIWNKLAIGDGSYTPPIPVNGRFTFESDFDTAGTLELPDGVNSLRAILGADEFSILKIWDGEFEFDNAKVILHKERGADNGVTVKFGKNMTDLTVDISTEKMYTHVFPYAKRTTYVEPEVPEEYGDGEEEDPYYEEETGEGETIINWIYAPTGDSPSTDGNWHNRIFALKDGNETLASKYGFIKVKILDLTGVFEGNDEFDSYDVKEQCENYISTNKEIKRPKVTITVGFEPKSANENKRYSEKLEKIGLCDTVRVVYPLYRLDEKLKVIKTEYDTLRERYKSIEIGDPKSTFASTIRDNYDT